MNLDDLNKLVQTGKMILQSTKLLSNNEEIGKLSTDFFNLVKDIEENVEKANKLITELSSVKDGIFRTITDKQSEISDIVNKLLDLSKNKK